MGHCVILYILYYQNAHIVSNIDNSTFSSFKAFFKKIRQIKGRFLIFAFENSDILQMGKYFQNIDIVVQCI